MIMNHPTASHHSLIEEQKSLEDMMLKEAEARQDRQAEKASKRRESGSTTAGRVYVRSIGTAIVEPVTAFLDPVKRAGRQQASAKLLKDTGISPFVISYLTAKAIINNIVMRNVRNNVKRTTICRAIGDLIHDEWRTNVFAQVEERKALLIKLSKDHDKRAYPREWRKRTIMNYYDAEQLDWEGWTVKERINIGYALFSLFYETTGLMEYTDGKVNVYPSDTFMAHIGDLLEKQASSFLLYQPMVVPPYDWTEKNLFRGGYISNKVRPYSIVKGARKRDVERFGTMDWSNILPALNSIQRTPWRVNKTMVEAVDWAYREYLGNPARNDVRSIGKLVNPEPRKLPPVPEGYMFDEEITKAHNLECFLIHDENRQDKSRRVNVVMGIQIAKQFSHYNAIYFPHNLDSRGRAYPLPATLNPQGPDYIKSMLEFSDGLPIETKEDADWLAIACANAYGEDKIHLHERVEWVANNEDMILSIAYDWRHDLRWMQAGEPFQFLRACIEWEAFKVEGYGFKSHLVVPVDATCSGIQHYAAMLRDEVCGKAVNLVPGLSRQDIYGDVANVVMRELNTMLSSTSVVEYGEDLDKEMPVKWIADGWLKVGITRKDTKRQVMVVPYAGKFKSCLKYTQEAIKDRLKAGVALPWNTKEKETHNVRMAELAKLIWNGINETVLRPKEAMNWLGKVARRYAQVANSMECEPYQRRMTWKTPDGFEVCHYQEEETKDYVDTYFDGRVRLVTWSGTGRLNVNEMVSAVAPNFVHALDATLMRLVVILAKAMAINCFAMVHDSFGVHASRMSKFLNQCIKPAFVKMYTEHNVLQEFYDRFKVVGELPPVPPMGKLDINGILDSEFVFS